MGPNRGNVPEPRVIGNLDVETRTTGIKERTWGRAPSSNETRIEQIPVAPVRRCRKQ